MRVWQRDYAWCASYSYTHVSFYLPPPTHSTTFACCAPPLRCRPRGWMSPLVDYQVSQCVRASIVPRQALCLARFVAAWWNAIISITRTAQLHRHGSACRLRALHTNGSARSRNGSSVRVAWVDGWTETTRLRYRSPTPDGMLAAAAYRLHFIWRKLLCCLSDILAA